MATQPDEEWREFYTEVGFRHGFALGAKAVRAAAGPHLSAEQARTLDTWLADEVAGWTRKYLSEEEPPSAPKL
jgi:hypothetical protein